MINSSLNELQVVIKFEIIVIKWSLNIKVTVFKHCNSLQIVCYKSLFFLIFHFLIWHLSQIIDNFGYFLSIFSKSWHFSHISHILSNFWSNKTKMSENQRQRGDQSLNKTKCNTNEDIQEVVQWKVEPLRDFWRVFDKSFPLFRLKAFRLCADRQRCPNWLGRHTFKFWRTHFSWWRVNTFPLNCLIILIWFQWTYIWDPNIRRIEVSFNRQTDRTASLWDDYNLYTFGFQSQRQ